MSAIGTKQTLRLLAVNVCFRTRADIAGPRAKVAGRLDDGDHSIGRREASRSGAIACLRLRHDHRVNDVDDAIGNLNVGLHDLGVIDLHAAGRIDVDFAALDRLRHRFLAGDILGHHLPGDDMISEDCDKLALVLGLEKVLNGAGRKQSPCWL